ncbi:hypothetical protein DFP72DRAFT_1069052 [Ephemerocybe angulata]|uniref:Uncharacterized protein n=1 Tax=Ephemerocybe angulata TaxID=980116 RepID=A0A8H6M5J7_9AGAR|nr:hypothetical protein DFP72DRAFT_1069052 [Tulosesus angulatus]
MVQQHDDSDASLGPPYTQSNTEEPVFISRFTGRPIPRPSDGWLRNPAHMDGYFDPPHVYVSRAQINEASDLWGAYTGIYRPPSPPAEPSTPAASLGSTFDSDSSGINTPNLRAYQVDCTLASISPTPISISALSVIQRGTIVVESSNNAVAAPSGSGPEAETDATHYIIRFIIIYPAPLPVAGGRAVSKKKPSIAKVFSADLKTITRSGIILMGLVAHTLEKRGSCHFFPKFSDFWIMKKRSANG